MGNHSSHLKPSAMKRLANVIIMLNALLAQVSAGDETERTSMSNAAQQYIEAFRRGEDFVAPAKGVFRDGEPDGAVLDVLGRELAAGSPNVRDNIVRLLVDMDQSTDPLTAKGAEVLRNQRILALLAGPGLASQDVARETSMESLRKLATGRDLAAFGEAFTSALERAPSDEALLLVAKAKPSQARQVVDKLRRLPRWQNAESARIASAALGSTVEEDRFLAAATAATTGEALANALGPLGLMGTSRSLKVTAELLRSPLTIEISGHMPGKSVKSVRLNVLDALLYNFPDQPVLYPNNINQDEDYRAAERFCTATFGVVYRDPPPPYLKYGNLPPEPLRR